MRLRLILLLLVSLPAAAQPLGDAAGLVGDWLTEDGGGVIAITPCDRGLCGRIVGISAVGRGPAPPPDYAGRPRCGGWLLNAAPIEPGVADGEITNPDNGTVWRVRLRAAGPDRLDLRGYVLLPALGQTQHWTRYRGALGTDCRME